MKILHTSDLHGGWRFPTQFQDFDVWVDSGDFMPNASRGTAVEFGYQKAWMTCDKLSFRKKATPLLRSLHGTTAGWFPSDRRQPPFKGSIAAELTAWLNGRPMLIVPGNHDYADLAAVMRNAGARVMDLTKSVASLQGVRFAGLREINWIEGEWAGESHGPEIRESVDRAMSADPQVLVTHSPPNGLLDCPAGSGGHVGLSYLTQYLTYRPHGVDLVLCGHVHEEGGKLVEEMGIRVSNAANSGRIIAMET
jgi:Icc-related predicted phosphoesterase